MTLLVCCGRPVVWVREDGWWYAVCRACERFYANIDPDPDDPPPHLSREESA